MTVDASWLKNRQTDSKAVGQTYIHTDRQTDRRTELKYDIDARGCDWRTFTSKVAVVWSRLSLGNRYTRHNANNIRYFMPI